MSEEPQHREDDQEADGKPPKYDNAAEEGTIVDGGHSAAAIGETGAKGERVDG